MMIQGPWMKIQVTESDRGRKGEPGGREVLSLGGIRHDVHHSNMQ